jgi:hypothetical protein
VFTPKEILFIEAKGRKLPMGEMKRKQVEDIYPVRIEVVRNIQELLDLAVNSDYIPEKYT